VTAISHGEEVAETMADVLEAQPVPAIRRHGADGAVSPGLKLMAASYSSRVVAGARRSQTGWVWRGAAFE
jgi:hypothetical protein